MPTTVVELPYHQPVPDSVIPDLRNGILLPRINGYTELRRGTVFMESLVVGARTWNHNLTWTATDYNTASWGSGAIRFSDGTSYSIDAGNTGDISATTYIYFDGTSVLKTTTTYTDAVGDTKVLLAIVQVAGDTDAKSIITALNSPGTTIDGNKVVTGKIVSTDGKTYFDLDGDEILMNDGSNDRLHLGYDADGY